ncbi:anthrone oxygenase family protein [Niabella yanshanensis]|uniref:Anthrone oxygenase family protein n=1 Tax=Niabella yanshanensis TaxID=577386 RepID=A0ABZ0W979_9BACT|nr:anthrone oxygenase family protein [Niabella yanshanensis]WQD39163.1 anthrone oxygenase family protein [Niabella yanshanensis]
MNIYFILYGSCLLLTGLSAGLFYSYQCSVINGLGVLPTREYLLSFQGINKAILNPVFFASFIGSLLLLVLTALLVWYNSISDLLPYLVTALIIYALGVFAVTAAGNVPLNEELARLDLTTATGAELEQFRQKFEVRWNRLNLVRTIGAILAFMALIIPCIKKLAATI